MCKSLMHFDSAVSNTGRADERHRQESGRRHRGLCMCESAVADAESADQFRRDLPDFPDVDALRNDDAPRAANAVALPERQPGRTSHQRADVLHDLSPEPEPEHHFTLHDYA